jgi:hypothetical protein
MATEFEVDTAGPAREFEVSSPNEEIDGPLPASPEVAESLAIIHSITRRESVDDTKARVSAFGISGLNATERKEAYARLSLEANGALQEVVNSSPSDVAFLESLKLVGQLARDEELITNSLNPGVYNVMTAEMGSDAKLADAMFADRAIMLQRLLDEETQTGALGGIWSFVDLMATSIFALDFIAGGAKTRRNIAKDLRRDLSNSFISNEEFLNRARAGIREGADSGFFSDYNYFYASSTALNINQGGTGQEARLDKYLSALDAFTVPGIVAVPKALLRSRTVIDMTSTLATRRANGIVAAISDTGDNALAQATGLPRAQSPALGRFAESGDTELETWLAPGIADARRMETSNRFFRLIQAMPWVYNIDEAKLEAAMPRLLAELVEDDPQAARILGTDVIPGRRIEADQSDNLIGYVLYGTKRGQTFKAAANGKSPAAEQMARNLSGDARAIKVPGTDGKEWMVVRSQNVLPGEIENPLQLNEIGTWLFRKFASSAATTPGRLDGLAKRGEAALQSARRELERALVPIKKKVKDKGEINVIGAIMKSLRDGDLSEARKGMNETEFRSEWVKHTNGKLPSKEAEDYFFTIQEANNALYLLKADVSFKEYIRNGFTDVLSWNFGGSGYDAIAKQIDRATLTPEQVVYNIETGEIKPLSELGNAKIYQTDGLFEFGEVTAKYITGEGSSARRMRHSDALGYNPGGVREYDGTINHFVKQVRKAIVTGSLEEITMKPLTILGTFSRQEAERAARQIDAIFSVVRREVDGIAGMTRGQIYHALGQLSGKSLDDLREAIRANNEWNVDLNEVEDLIKFLKDEVSLDPRLEVGVAARDDTLATLTETGTFAFPKNRTHNDEFLRLVNPSRNGPRRDKPILGMGGKEAGTIDPLQTIENDMGRTIYKRAYQAYNQRAVSAWVAGASDHIQNLKDLEGASPTAILRNAVFSDKPTKEARSFIEAGETMKRVLSLNSGHYEAYQRNLQRVAEWVYDKYGKDVRAITNLGAIARPAEFLRAAAFHARLGLLASDQFAVQASQVVMIAGIMGPARAVEIVQNGVAVIPLRLMHETDNLAVLKGIADKAAPMLGLTSEELISISQTLKKSGRLDIGHTIGELGEQGVKIDINLLNKTLGRARFFFDEGEKVPRTMAYVTAWKEFKKTFPKGDPLGDTGRTWIADRSDKLTGMMTGAGAARWQRGPLSVPLQFQTFAARMLESIFSGSALTGAERRRLFIAQSVYFGAAGWGLTSALDSFILENDLDIPKDAYIALKYGGLDAILSITGITDGEVAFGERFAAAEGITSLIETIGDKKFLDIALGPGGKLVKDVLTDTFEIATNALNGRSALTTDDVRALARNITSYNKGYQAWVIWRDGELISREDKPSLSGLSRTVSIGMVLGATSTEASSTYNVNDFLRNKGEILKTHGGRLRELMRTATRAYADGDMEAFDAAMTQFGHGISVLEPYENRQIKHIYEKSWEDFGTSLIRRLRSQGKGALPTMERNEGTQ